MHDELSDDLYVRFRELLLSRSGLYYPERKRADLAHGLALVLAATGCSNLDQLYAEAAGGGPVWDALLEQLTIGETHFFRNGPQFEALRQHIFAELLARRAATRSLRIWSAGCASGEEPYSIAMLLSMLLPDLDSWYLSILATDINPHFLARAREGLYGEWSFRETSEDLRQRFFSREEPRWRLRPEIRRMVTFARLNLVEPCYPSVYNGTTALDLILCRNVTIYFDEATTRQVAERLYGALAPGGWLVVGHAEPHAATYYLYEVHNFPGAVIYRKPLDAPPFGSLESQIAAAPQPRPGTAPLQRRPGTAPLQPPGSGPLAQKPGSRPGTAPLQSPGTRPLKRPGSGPLPDEATTPAERWEVIAGHLADGDRAAAEPLLHELLHLEPHHAKALLSIARLYADRGELASAEAYCKQLLERDALHVEAHSLLGQIYEHRDELDSALVAYRSATFLDPGCVAALIGQAAVWRRMGRSADARRCYRNALSRLATYSPGSPVPGLDGATASELVALISQQLLQLGSS